MSATLVLLAQETNIVVTVNGVSINQSQINEASSGIDLAFLSQENFEDLVLFYTNDLIDKELLRQKSKSIVVNEKLFNQTLKDWKVQQGLTDKSNQEAYIELLANAGYSQERFENLFHEEMKLQAYREAQVQRVQLSDEEALAFFTQNFSIYEESSRLSVSDFEQFEDQVYSDALAIKQLAFFERHLNNLRTQANIVFHEESSYFIEDYAVARVGNTVILRSELLHALYTDPAVANFFNANSQVILTEIFKPLYLTRLIDSELAYQGSFTLATKFIGTKAVIGQSALAFAGNDVTVNEQDLLSYYEENIDQYAEPGKANVIQIDFENHENAIAFREDMLESPQLFPLALKHSGSVEDLGVVVQGQVNTSLNKILFNSEGFTPLKTEKEISLPFESISLEESTSFSTTSLTGYSVLLAKPIPAIIEVTFEEAIEEMHPLVLTQKRFEASEVWLNTLREQITVENYLSP